MMPEPVIVYPEAELQKALVGLITEILREYSKQFIVVEKFGLDVAVFLGRASSSAVRLFEVKVFGGQRMGGVGFGNRLGVGPQVDLLLNSDSDLRLIDSSIRWAYADALQAPRARRFGLFTCTTAKKAAMGKTVARGKQNNLRVAALREGLVIGTNLGRKSLPSSLLEKSTNFSVLPSGCRSASTRLQV